MKQKVKKSHVPAQREEEYRIERMRARLQALRVSPLEGQPGASVPPPPEHLQRAVDD